MQIMREWLRRLWATLHPGRADQDLAEELRSHIELAAEHGRREIGGAQAIEALRDQRGLPWLDTLLRDLRHGVRVLTRSPFFTIVAIVSLALGIGANAAIFQLIDAVQLRSLPVVNPQELAEVRVDGPSAFGIYESVNATATYPLWREIRSRQHAFARMGAWGDTAFLVGRGADARAARGLWVSGDLFPVLGIVAERGRLIAPADDRPGCGADGAVVSHGFWQTYFGGSMSVVGNTIVVGERPFTVVGVTPPSFTGLEVGQTFDVALPLCSAELWGAHLEQRDRWWLAVIGRLRPGRTIAQASAELHTLSGGLLDATLLDGYGPDLLDRYRKLQFSAVPGGRGVSRLRGAYGTSLSLLLGLTGLLLLITCGNLATLLLARASARERELAVRAALGASRPRLVQQLVIESLLLAAAGAALAVPVAVFSARTLVAFLDTTINPVTLSLAPDWRLLTFIAAIATLTALAFGCIPAFRVSFVRAGAAMAQMSRRATVDRHRARFQRVLVAIQVAVSLVLIVSAMLFVQTFRKLAAVDVGFNPAGATAVLFTDPASRDLPAEQVRAFQQQLTDAIRTVPGVTSAALSMHLPLGGDVFSHFFRVPGAPGDGRKASRFAYVGSDYFQTMRIPIRAGRGFADSDNTHSRPVLVVNESFVRSHLAGRSPVGAVIQRFAEPDYPETSYEIVGVVGDTKYGDLRDENCWCDRTDGVTAPIAYVPIAQSPKPYAWPAIIVRAAAGATVSGAIRDRVRRLNPGIAVGFIDLTTLIHQRLIGERITAWLAGAFGLLAMLLVSIGLHGLLAYLTVSRTNEIGIRLSLGSTRAQIVKLVLRDSALMIVVGVVIGVPLAVATMYAAQALLFRPPADAPTLAVAVTGLAVVAGLAGAIPAWRASRLDPNVALRAE